MTTLLAARRRTRRLFGAAALITALCTAAGAGSAANAGSSSATSATSTVNSPLPINSRMADPPQRTITTTVTDPDDTAGRLDIAAVRHRIAIFDSAHVSVAYRVTTYAEFRFRRLDARHRNFVLELNQDTERGAERSVRVSYRDGFGPLAEIFSNATRRVIGTVDVTSLDPHTFVIRGPRRVIGARSYFWTSNYHVGGPGPCGWQGGYPVSCQDTVPDSGWIRMDAPAWP